MKTATSSLAIGVNSGRSNPTRPWAFGAAAGILLVGMAAGWAGYSKLRDSGVANLSNFSKLTSNFFKPKQTVEREFLKGASIYNWDKQPLIEVASLLRKNIPFWIKTSPEIAEVDGSCIALLWVDPDLDRVHTNPDPTDPTDRCKHCKAVKPDQSYVINDPDPCPDRTVRDVLSYVSRYRKGP